MASWHDDHQIKHAERRSEQATGSRRAAASLLLVLFRRQEARVNLVRT
jgi:hypothetical protein